jgi:type IV pilus assembly protein PilB
LVEYLDNKNQKVPSDSQLKAAQTSTSAAPAAGNVNEALTSINRSFAEKQVIDAAKKTKLPYVDIALTPISPDLMGKIDVAEAEASLAIPFFVLGKKMRIAVVNPENPVTLEYLAKLKTKQITVQLNLASEEGIQSKIEQIKALQPHKDLGFENRDAEINLKNYEEEIKSLDSLETDAQNLAAKETLNRIFVGALRVGASDIHFQPEDTEIAIRFRVDGVLQKILSFNRKIGGEIVDQLKYEARLRLNVSNIPQDGRLSFMASERKIDMRVGTLPTEFGESVVCRLLDPGKKIRSLEELGFTDTNLENITAALNLRSGMILATGPTGSGKTTTLYTLLDGFNKPDRKVTTLENPIEYHIPNVVQSQIDENHNYTFGSGLRALLRQDPDVMMVGEIRDGETAETAAQAAMTGHILLSTLHTNSAVETIPRLLNLGMKPFVVAGSLALVIAQRLVRRPCAKCAEKINLTMQQRSVITDYLTEAKAHNAKLKVEAPDFILKAQGCEVCGHTGYRGQIVVAETFHLTDDLREMILKDVSVAEITKAIRKDQGMISFAEDGVIKACAGLTTFEEVARVTGLILAI